MNRVNSFYGFQFNDDLILQQYICPEPQVHFDTVIIYGYSNLSQNIQAELLQLINEDFFID